MRIDEFESQFKSSIKEPYAFSAVNISSVLLVSDKSEDGAHKLLDSVKCLVPDGDSVSWQVFCGSDYCSVKELLGKIEKLKPDLIISQRYLKLDEEDLVYGLTVYLDALTQVCVVPVLLLPNLTLDQFEHSLRCSSKVGVKTDHLTGDSNLINWAVRFAKERLFLTHIEDDAIFQRYMAVIGKIPEIDTDTSHTKIKEVLLREPQEFIDQVRVVFDKEVPGIEVEGFVKLGHRLADYGELLNTHEVDLLVLNTKVEGQLAMKSISYAIAVEYKDIPMLLL